MRLRLLPLLALACSQDAVLVVDVTAAAGLPEVTQLRVTTDDGTAAFPDVAGAPLAFPTAFSLTTSAGQTKVIVDGLGTAGVVGRGAAVVQLQAGTVTRTTVNLMPQDGGGGGAGDGSAETTPDAGADAGPESGADKPCSGLMAGGVCVQADCPGYVYSQVEADARCRTIGFRLCTFDELKAAYAAGYIICCRLWTATPCGAGMAWTGYPYASPSTSGCTKGTNEACTPVAAKEGALCCR